MPGQHTYIRKDCFGYIKVKCKVCTLSSTWELSGVSMGEKHSQGEMLLSKQCECVSSASCFGFCRCFTCHCFIAVLRGHLGFSFSAPNISRQLLGEEWAVESVEAGKSPRSLAAWTCQVLTRHAVWHNAFVLKWTVAQIPQFQSPGWNTNQFLYVFKLELGQKSIFMWTKNEKLCVEREECC